MKEVILIMNEIEQEFNSLFIKEQKLKKIQKEHVLAEITYISNCFKKRQSSRENFLLK